MKELFSMWRHTRMVVLVAVSAAVFAAVLIVFKPIAQLIPGFTEIRPANALPILCSALFGPAAAWGAAFGNVIVDVRGAPLAFVRHAAAVEVLAESRGDVPDRRGRRWPCGRDG